jgi:hypothetical protein
VSDLYPTRDRRGLLVAVDAGRVRYSLSGVLMWRRDGGQNLRVKSRIEEMLRAGWVQESGDEVRPFELTDAGRTAMVGARCSN